jgi:REP-associated tyrosine transposase
MCKRQPPRVRRRIRLAPETCRSGGAFLLTICAARGTAPFRDPQRANLVARRLQAALNSRGGPVVAYCVMPDHVHVVLAGSPDVVLWVREFKAGATAELRRADPAASPWQRSFHDRCLALHDESLDSAVTYVLENPVRACLVARAVDWPWAGHGLL